MKRLIECVPNFSEGRDPAKVDAIVQAMSNVPGVYVLDREMDADPYTPGRHQRHHDRDHGNRSRE